MRVYVTQEDIDNATRGDANSCPVARAVTRAALGYVADLHYVHVDEDWVSIVTRSKIAQQGTSIAVRKFVDAFDGSKPVKPFSFALSKKLTILFNKASTKGHN